MNTLNELKQLHTVLVSAIANSTVKPKDIPQISEAILRVSSQISDLEFLQIVRRHEDELFSQ